MGPSTRLAALQVPQSPPTSVVDEGLHELEAVSQDLETHTLAANTRRAYATAWRSFSRFCRSYDLEALPAHPETVRWYVAWMSTQQDENGLPRYSVATIRLHLAGIADHHLQHGSLDPTGHRGVVDLVRGLSKLRRTRPHRRRPLLLDDVQRIIGAMEHAVYPGGVSAARDTLAIWLGFAGALRRSEAAGLRVNSLRLDRRDGVHVHVGASKTDQDNTAPDLVVLPWGSTPATCPPCAVHRWVRLLVITQMASSRERRRALMSHLFGYQTTAHVCGRDVGGGLISSADLTSSTPLLRATYRNRQTAHIHERGISGDALHTMLRSRMVEAGMDPRGYGFHSLRSGHVTQARRNHAPTEEIMRAGRWQKTDTVGIYDREFNPADRNSVMRLGL